MLVQVGALERRGEIHIIGTQCRVRCAEAWSWARRADVESGVGIWGLGALKVGGRVQEVCQKGSAAGPAKLASGSNNRRGFGRAHDRSGVGVADPLCTREPVLLQARLRHRLIRARTA